MVVAMHSQSVTSGASALDAYFYSTLSYLTAPCIGLFFMISGALLLPSRVGSTKTFLSHRFGRILIPAIAWTFIYLAYDLLSGKMAIADAARAILSIPFSAQGNSVLWYIYTLIGLYLLIPVLSPWIEKASPRQILFYLSLWAVTLCYPYLRPLGFAVNGNMEGILYYFTGYVGYFVLGSYINRNMRGFNRPRAAAVAIVVCLMIPVPVKLLGVEVDFYSMFWYTSLPVAVMCAAWFIMLRAIPAPVPASRAAKTVTALSSLSFGIYLSHILFRLVIFDNHLFDSLPVTVATLFDFLIMAVGSTLLCFAIRKTPASRWLIGV